MARAERAAGGGAAGGGGGREEGAQRRAVAQVQVPVVGAGDGDAVGGCGAHRRHFPMARCAMFYIAKNTHQPGASRLQVFRPPGPGASGMGLLLAGQSRRCARAGAAAVFNAIGQVCPWSDARTSLDARRQCGAQCDKILLRKSLVRGWRASRLLKKSSLGQSSRILPPTSMKITRWLTLRAKPISCVTHIMV